MFILAWLSVQCRSQQCCLVQIVTNNGETSAWVSMGLHLVEKFHTLLNVQKSCAKLSWLGIVVNIDVTMQGTQKLFFMFGFLIDYHHFKLVTIRWENFLYRAFFLSAHTHVVDLAGLHLWEATLHIQKSALVHEVKNPVELEINRVNSRNTKPSLRLFEQSQIIKFRVWSETLHVYKDWIGQGRSSFSRDHQKHQRQ